MLVNSVVTIIMIGAVLGAFCGALGWVWYSIIQGGEIFSKVGDLLYETFANEPKLYRAIAGCPKCISGQVALWFGGGLIWTVGYVLNDWQLINVVQLHFITIIFSIYIGGKGG